MTVLPHPVDPSPIGPGPNSHPRPSSRRWLAISWRRLRSPLRLALALALGLALLWLGIPGTMPAPAQNNQSLPELQQRQQELNQQRQTLQQQQQELQQQTSTAEDRLSNLQDNIAATATQIADTEYQLQRAEQRLQELEVDLAAAEAAYEQQQQATVARLRFMQRQQGSEGWALLLQSENFNQFLERRYQLGRVFAADRTFLADLQTQAEDIQAQQAVVETQKNSVALLRQQLLTQKQQYEAEANTQNQLITRLNQDRAALEAAEAQLARDSDSIAAVIRERVAAAAVIAPDGGVRRGTGRFIYPVNARLTSGFGNRRHPILGYSRFHGGVDFGASHGTTIRAADGGQVIFAGWYGGYGRTVIVDHGGGITTLYAHASQIHVSVGQTVTQGQGVAAVGSTGLSTGPHLHFEVRQNGNPVNPLNYL